MDSRRYNADRSTPMKTLLVLAALVPYLVKDLSPGARTTAPRLDFWSATLGEVVFFGVPEEEAGMWRTDGTAAGTHRIYDGIPDWHVAPRPPAQWNGFLYYPVITAAGTWLARTDGTTPGTATIAKIAGWYGGAPCGDGKLCFATEGSSVAITDGTAAGTSVLLSTASGYETYRPREMTAMGKRVFFNAYDDRNGLCMRVPAGLGTRQVCGDLWTSDGTAAGTHLFKDLLPGGAPGAPEHLFASSAGRLYFAAADPTRPQIAQAWVSDGTAEGTRVLSPKGSDWSASPYFTEIAGRVFFSTSDGDLFETDGTPEGTRSVRGRFPSQDFILGAVDGGGKVLLWAGYYGRPELWSYDGTKLEKLADIPTAFSYLGYLAPTGRTWFISDAGDVWSTDGTPAGTGRQFSVRATGATMYGVAVTPTRLYFGEGYNRYVTDGTKAGTYQLPIRVRVPDSTWPGQGWAINGRYFFNAPGRVGSSDGTEAGTAFLSNHTGDVFAHQGHTYFYQSGELWKTDGTPAGTIRAADWLGVDWPRPPAFIGNQAVFAAGGFPERVLRRDADGSLHDLRVDANGFSRFVAAAGGVAFWAGSPLRLIFTDGTAAGTRTVVSSAGTTGELVVLGRKAVYGQTGRELSGTVQLWVTDFTAEGTRAIKDIPETSFNDELIPLLTWRNLSIFRVGPFAPRGVWRTDGTTEGTFQLASGAFDAVLADGDELVLVRFTNPGYEVWTSDGTVAGTKKRDVHTAGVKAGEPFIMSGGGVGVIYTTVPKEVHIRNHRTKAVQVIVASGLRSLGGGVGVGDRVFFNGYRGATGHELWAVRLDQANPSPQSDVRVEYVGTARTAAGAGAVFRVRVDAAGAAVPSVTATTADGTLTAGRDYVPVTREIVFEEDRDVTLFVPLRDRNAQGTLSVVLSAPVNATITRGLATADVGEPRRQRSVRH